jgi:hypothetical protein
LEVQLGNAWLRVHWRLGAEYLEVTPKATVITETVAEWEEWSGMSFPESSEYVFPGALQLVIIDREQNVGHYEAPNVWMCYTGRHPQRPQSSFPNAYPGRAWPQRLRHQPSRYHRLRNGPASKRSAS